MIWGQANGTQDWLDWLFGSMTWLERGILVVCLALALFWLPRWGWTLFRMLRDSSWRCHRDQLVGTAGTTLVLVLIVVVGALLLGFDRPAHHHGSSWLLIGLMGFLRPLRAIWEPPQVAPIRRGPAWLLPNQVEVLSSCLMLLIGIINLL